MLGASKFVFSFLMISVLALFVQPTMFSSTAYAHNLYPDEECTPILIHADITQIKINWEASLFEFDDPVGLGDGEVAIIYTFFESAHEQAQVKDRIYIDDWNYFIHNRVPFHNNNYHRDIPEHNVYLHATCLEDLDENHLIASFQVIEIDADINSFEELEDRLYDWAWDQPKEEAFFTVFKANPVMRVVYQAIDVVHIFIQTAATNENLGVAIYPVDLGEEVYEWEPTIETLKLSEVGTAEISFRVWIEEQTCPDDFDSQDYSHNLTLADYTMGDSGIHFLGNANESQINYVQLDDSVSVPGWVKTNAQWWSEGLLSDSEFVSGIEFLVENRIISSPTLQIVDAPAPVTIFDGYVIPDGPQDFTEIPISGFIENPEFEEIVVIEIQYPDGSYEEKTALHDNGHFTTNFFLQYGNPEGTYIVFAIDDKRQKVQIQTFDAAKNVITDSAPKSDKAIPEWIKNNAKWWADGLIGDSDFVSGIEFMVEEKIITTPRITVSEIMVTPHVIEQPTVPKTETLPEMPSDSVPSYTEQDEDLSSLSLRAETDPLLDPIQQVIRVVSKDVTIEKNEFRPGHTATYHWKLQRDNGEPAADASVWLVQNDGRKYGPTKTDDQGNLYYDRSEPGTWTLKVDSMYHPYVQNYGQYFAGCDELVATIP